MWVGNADYTSSSSPTDPRLKVVTSKGKKNDFIDYLNGGCTLSELIESEKKHSMTTDCLGAIFYWVLKSGAIEEQKVKNFLCDLRSKSGGYFADGKTDRVSISEMKALCDLIKHKTLLTDIQTQKSSISPGDIILFHITFDIGNERTNVIHYALSTGEDQLIESITVDGVIDLLVLKDKILKNKDSHSIVASNLAQCCILLENMGLSGEITRDPQKLIPFLFGPEFDTFVNEKNVAHTSTISQTLASVKKKLADISELKTKLIVLHNPLDAINAMDSSIVLTPEVLIYIER